MSSFKDAQDAYRREDFDLAQKGFYQAAWRAKELYDVNSEKYLETMKRLAWVCEEQGQYAKARAIISKVKELSPKMIEHFKCAQVLAYAPLPQLRKLLVAGVTVGPECSLGAQIYELETYTGPADPGLVPLYKLLADTYTQAKEYRSAEDVHVKLVSIAEDSQGPESIGVANARIALADFYKKWGEVLSQTSSLSEAEKLHRQAKESYEIAAKLYQGLLGPSCQQLGAVKKKQTDCQLRLDQIQAAPAR